MSSTPFAVSFPNIPDAGTRHFGTFAEAAAFVARAGFHAVVVVADVIVARNGSMGGPVVAVGAIEVRHQQRGDAFGIYLETGNGWPALLESGIATLEAAETRALDYAGGR